MGHNILQKTLQTTLESLCANEGYCWNADLIKDLPKKWELHGDLLLFSSSSFSKPIWKDLDQLKLWKCVADVFKVKRIAKQDKICSDGLRTPSVLMLLGEETWVTHIDNKIKYNFDVTKCMFSSGNITEKIRMAQFNCQEEVIVDMFAGIGYFTLPLLVHGKAKFIHACEWNPDAVEALRRNLHDNKVTDRCEIHEGDNREVCPKGVADRVVLGLIPTAEASYVAACQSLKQCGVATLHIHSNVSSSKTSKTKSDTSFNNDENSNFGLLHDSIDAAHVTCNRRLKPEWLNWAVKTAKEIKNILCNSASQLIPATKLWKLKILHIERVKSYAPHNDHLVLDLQCEPCWDAVLS